MNAWIAYAYQPTNIEKWEVSTKWMVISSMHWFNWHQSSSSNMNFISETRVFILCVCSIVSKTGVRNLTSRRSLATLILGVFVGFVLAAVFISTSDTEPRPWLRDPHVGADLADAEGPEKDVGYHASQEEAHALENKTVAQRLYNEVKILCWIMTSPKNHQKKARHVKRTWGSRCNKIIFMSSAEGKLCSPSPFGVSSFSISTDFLFSITFSFCRCGTRFGGVASEGRSKQFVGQDKGSIQIRIWASFGWCRLVLEGWRRHIRCIREFAVHAVPVLPRRSHLFRMQVQAVRQTGLHVRRGWLRIEQRGRATFCRRRHSQPKELQTIRWWSRGCWNR